MKLNVTIVGAGLMGRWHAHAAQHAGARVVSVVDPDGGAASRLARRFGASAFAGIEEMLAAGRPDVIHICSPRSTHFSIAERALNAGCHLLIEKPMTDAASETERLIDLAARLGLYVNPVHQFPFQEGVLKARRRLPSIGRLVDASIVVISGGGAGLGNEASQEIACDVLPHPLSLIPVFLPGSLAEISWSVVSSRPGELRISGDAADPTVSIFVSMNARPTANFLELRGEQGTMHVDLFHGYCVLDSAGASRATKLAQPFRWSTKNFSAATMNLGRRVLQNEPAYPGLRRLVAAFYDAVRHKSPPPVSTAEAMMVARVRDNIRGQLLECGCAPSAPLRLCGEFLGKSTV